MVTDYHFERPYFHELYDLDADPHQLHNSFEDAPAPTARWLKERVADLWGCAGDTCP